MSFMPPSPRGSVLRRVISIKPYGSDLLTNAAAAWILIVRLLILLMATCEAISWAYVGSFFFSGNYWPFSAFVTGAAVFVLIWAIDISLMTLDRARPLYEARMYERATSGYWERSGKTMVAFGSRWLIIIVSLSVTAPYLSQIVLHSEIQKEFERDTKSQIEVARKALELKYDTPINTDESLLSTSQVELTDEIAGRPVSRTKQFGDGPVAKSIRERVDYKRTELDALKQQKKDDLKSFDNAVATNDTESLGDRWGVVLPANSIMKRDEILAKLEEKPTYSKTRRAVTTFMIFLIASLSILKLFEPRGIKIYLSEALQQEWRRYCAGAFDAWMAFHERSTAANSSMTAYRFEDLMINTYPAIRREDLARRESQSTEREARDAIETLNEIEKEMADTFSQMQDLEQALAGVEGQISNVTSTQGTLSLRYAQQQEEIEAFEGKVKEIESLIASRSNEPADIEMLKLFEEQAKAAIKAREDLDRIRKAFEQLEQQKSVFDSQLMPLYEKRKHLSAELVKFQNKAEELESAKDEIRTQRIAAAAKRGVGKAA